MYTYNVKIPVIFSNSLDRSMREVIDLLSSDTSADQSSFDYDSHSIENPANLSYFSNKQDSLMSVGSVEAYTYDFERLFSIKGKSFSISADFL